MSIESEEVSLPMNAQRLVSFLALHDRPLLRAFVFGSLWGESTDQHAGGSLRSALWRLRRPKYTLVTLTSEHIELSPTVAALSADLLPDWTEDLVLLERESYRQLRLRALEALCRRLSASGRFGQAVQAGLAAGFG